MIKLKMNHLMFDVIEEEVYAGLGNVMCGNEKGSPRISKQDFFSKFLKNINITFGECSGHDVFEYTTVVSEEDFIILYNQIIWSQYETFGCIKYNFFKQHVIELCEYLIKVKNEHNIKSTLDDFKNLLWFMEEENIE